MIVVIDPRDRFHEPTGFRFTDPVKVLRFSPFPTICRSRSPQVRVGKLFNDKLPNFFNWPIDLSAEFQVHSPIIGSQSFRQKRHDHDLEGAGDHLFAVRPL